VDATERVCNILDSLMAAVQKATDEIHEIGEQERKRAGEETPEGQAWDSFAGFGLFSDVGRASRNIDAELAAVRGFLLYRGIDKGQRQ
jgi:hypothetical protein